MIQKISQFDFVDAFQMNDTRKNTFSYDALIALFEFYEDYEQETGETVELDIIRTCCEFTEYSSAWEAMQEYQSHDMPTIDAEGLDLVEVEELQQNAALQWLHDRTTVLEFDGGVVIADF